jgi:hypothetical protein
MTGTVVPTYEDPVRRLLDIGETADYRPDEWPDYPATFGFGPDHVPALIRMTCDRDLHDLDAKVAAGWAPMHAGRTLAQLRTTEAIEPLLALVRAMPGYDLISEEVPVVLGIIGPATIEPIQAFIATAWNDPERPAGTGIAALKQVADHNPDTRDRCIGIFAELLTTHDGLNHWEKGCIVSALLDLKAVEAIDAIRAAFAANAIDLSVAGDLEDVEIDLGLRATRTTPKPSYNPLLDLFLKSPPASSSFPPETIPVRTGPKIGRNDPCPCGSGKKFKKCCGA